MSSVLFLPFQKQVPDSQRSVSIQQLRDVAPELLISVKDDGLEIDASFFNQLKRSDYRDWIQKNSSFFVLENKEVPVLEMTCAACANAVQRTVQKSIGVIDAQVNFATQTLEVKYVPEYTTLEQIQSGVQQAGFDLYIPQDNASTPEELQLEHIQNLKRKAVGALILAFPVFILGMFFMHWEYSNPIQFFFTTLILGIFGRDFYIKAWNQALRAQSNMDTLVAISTAVAYLFSLINWWFPQAFHHTSGHSMNYFEAAAVVIAFVLLGRFLEERAKGQTSTALMKLMGLQPKTVRVNRDGNWVDIALEKVNKDDLVWVKPGEKIALDGEVIEGSSFVDNAALTGESMPVPVEIGSKVHAGTQNLNGSFRFRVTQKSGETLLDQMIQAVRKAQGSKAPVQRKVDAIASVFVPVILVLSVITLALWLLFSPDQGWNHGLVSAITVLVIACPCALGLATPTAIMVGIGKAAEHGILIKDAESLEKAKSIDVVVVDKTGTLTEGTPTVTDEFWTVDDPLLPKVISALEAQSEHPLAKAVVAHFPEMVPLDAIRLEVITGKGLIGTFENRNYRIGNRELFRDQNLEIPDPIISKAEEWETSGKTVLFMGIEEKAVGILAVEDAVKPTSERAIRELQESGIEVIMLTGDAAPTAKRIADEVGITTYQAQCMPQDKVQYIEALQKQGKQVAMVGDGINDAAALATAQIGMAMGKGSEIALDVAQIALVHSDLLKIPQALQIAKQTVRTINQNLFWAFIYNLIGIPVAAGLLYPLTGFLLHPMYAGAAMALSSVSVVLNSLYLKYKS